MLVSLESFFLCVIATTPIRVCANDGVVVRQKMGSLLAMAGAGVQVVAHLFDGRNARPGPKSKWFMKKMHALGSQIGHYGVEFKANARFDWIDNLNKYQLVLIGAGTATCVYFTPTAYRTCIRDPLTEFYHKMTQEKEQEPPTGLLEPD